MIESLVGIHVVLGVVSGVITVVIISEEVRFDTREARYAAATLGGIGMFLFWPLLVVGVVLYFIPKGLWILGKGTRDLYRQYRPVKTKIPEARIHR